MEKMFYTVQEAARALAYHHNGVIQLINSGRIKPQRVGRSYIIPSSEVRRIRKQRIAELETKLEALKASE